MHLDDLLVALSKAGIECYIVIYSSVHFNQSINHVKIKGGATKKRGLCKSRELSEQASLKELPKSDSVVANVTAPGREF